MNDDNKNKKEEETIKFSHEGEKYEAKNVETEQSLEGKKDKSKKITVKGLKKGFFVTNASVNGKEKKIYHLPFWGGIGSIIVLVFGGLAWFLISRKNRQQTAQEEDVL